jgi:hypothetical protein
VRETKHRETGLSLDRWLEQHSTLAILFGLVAIPVSYVIERHAPSKAGMAVSLVWGFLLSAGVVFALAGLRITIGSLRSRHRSD